MYEGSVWGAFCSIMLKCGSVNGAPYPSMKHSTMTACARFLTAIFFTVIDEMALSGTPWCDKVWQRLGS